jgi:4'-phosphopantetheinyl transferase
MTGTITTRRAAALRLRPHDIDVWRAALDDQPAEVLQYLQTVISPDEAGRAHRFYFERDRRRFVIGRGILRLLLGRYLGREPGELVFRYGENGKPALATLNGGPPPLYFNVTHSEGLAVYAFTRAGEVGVDIERIRDIPELEQIAGSYFPPGELARILACPEERRRDEFFRAWTRQEAVLKATGVGLGGTGTAAAPLRSAEEPPVSAAGFCVHPLDPAPGFAGALAVGPACQWTTFTAWHPPAGALSTPRRGRRIQLQASSHEAASL